MDKTIPMICCDKCDRWYHGACLQGQFGVVIYNEELQFIKGKWTCLKCAPDDIFVPPFGPVAPEMGRKKLLRQMYRLMCVTEFAMG